MRYVLVEDETDKILKEVEGDKEFRSGTPPDLPQKPFRWLPLEITNPDIPSRITHLKEGPVTTVRAKKITRVWTVRPKTADELDTIKEEQIPHSDSIQFKTMLDVENRTLALEGKPTVTVLEYRETLKGML
tara:strand:+ start:231 stop:623 length:393 start_codon:yes stop_codon:yes gene_type:complete